MEFETKANKILNSSNYFGLIKPNYDDAFDLLKKGAYKYKLFHKFLQ